MMKPHLCGQYKCVVLEFHEVVYVGATGYCFISLDIMNAV